MAKSKSKNAPSRPSFSELEEKRLGFEKYIVLNNMNGITAIVIGDDPENPGSDAIIVRHSNFAPESITDSIPEEFEGLPIRRGVADYQPNQSYSENTLHNEGGKQNFQSALPTDRQNRIRPGISISHPRISAGSIGCIVVNKATKKLGILSNWHVLVGKAGKKGDAVLQPGTADSGKKPNDIIGHVNNWVLDTDGDAAVAVVNDSRRIDSKTFGSNVSYTGAREPERDELVIKSGRTTGVTKGIVKRSGKYTISYDVGPVTVFGYEIEPVAEGNPSNEEISSGGDSGAGWYSKSSNHIIGLHFAGETDPLPSKEHAIACSVVKVLKRLNCKVASKQDIGSHIYTESNLVEPENTIANKREKSMILPFPYPPRPYSIFSSPTTNYDNSYIQQSMSGIFPPPQRPCPNPVIWADVAEGSSQISSEIQNQYIEYLISLGSPVVTDILIRIKSNGITLEELERLGKGWELTRDTTYIPSSLHSLAPELLPVAWAAIGFAAGATARLVGRENVPEILGLSVAASAFIIGAVVGSRAVDGKL